jgi:anaerobic magnesium-protoporphyrin IX monomethyl ester cyclase
MNAEYGIRHFFFLDYTFTLDGGWVRELCEAIQSAQLDISWVCQTRVDCLDEDTLMTMRQAGCAGVWLGIESPDLEQRRYLSKGRIGFDAIQEGVDLIRRCGLQALSFVMVGLPNETESSLRSLNSWLTDSAVYYSLSTFQRRMGTPLADGGHPASTGWEYLDDTSEFLGESELRIADLDWFFDYHKRSPWRVANIVRRSSTTTAIAP